MSKKAKEIIKLVNEIKDLCETNINKVAVLDQDVNALQGKTEEPQNKNVLTEEEAIYYWTDWREGKKGDAQFVGFAEFYLSDKLVAGKKYGFEVGPVVLVGEQLQMVVMLFEPEGGLYSYKYDLPVGLLVQTYKVGTPEFVEMLHHVYDPPFPMLVEISTRDISDANGTITLKKDANGKLALDWGTFDPEQTPCGEAWAFSENLSAEMDEVERDNTKILRGQAA